MGGLAIARSDREATFHGAAAFTGLVAWLAYTRVFSALQGMHATLPACPFLLLTGHPCPLCGGTRSFAAMWHGDLAAAARYHPLGPALFVVSLAAAAGLGLLLATGRTLRWSGAVERRVVVAVAALFAAAWLFRLAFLPLPS